MSELHVGFPAAPMGLQICLLRIPMVYMRDSDMVMNKEYSRYRATLIVPGLQYYMYHVWCTSNVLSLDGEVTFS